MDVFEVIFRRPIIDLVLKEEYYRMIESGEKKEEYRDLKPYWWSRLFTSPYHKMQSNLNNLEVGFYDLKSQWARLRLGYSNDEMMIWKLGHSGVGYAKPEWAMPGMGKVIKLALHERHW